VSGIFFVIFSGHNTKEEVAGIGHGQRIGQGAVMHHEIAAAVLRETEVVAASRNGRHLCGEIATLREASSRSSQDRTGWKAIFST